MTDLEVSLLCLQLCSTLVMVGVIWFVQIVHYPLFAQVGVDAFRRYEMDHQRLTSWVVGPPMLTELGTAVALLWLAPAALPSLCLWLGFGLVLLIWLVTYTIQVPQHAALILAYDGSLARRLVNGNWIRTVAWTARGILVVWMVMQLVPDVHEISAGGVLP